MKTSFTEYLERLELEIRYINDTDSKEDKYYRMGLKVAKNLIAEFKEKEKDQIIDAFKRGLINEMNGIEELNSEQYYSETFNNND